MTSLWARLKAMPRSAQWVVIAAVLFGGYFLIVEPVLDLTNRHATAADAIENNLRRASELSSDDSDDGRLLANGIKTFGKPAGPGKAGADSIQRIVDQVLDDHRVESATKTERTSTLTGDRARELAGDGRIERELIEVSFEADQATVANVIADLERSPGIAAVSRIKIDRTSIGRYTDQNDPATAGLVRASLTAESWTLVRGRSASTGDDNP